MTAKKTIPSEDVNKAWLAGIIDGEGSIGIYTTAQNRIILNLSIVNSDMKIIKKSEEVFKELGIFTSTYLHNNKKPKGYTTHKQCYVVTVRRKADFKKAIEILLPFLIGDKQDKAKNCLQRLTTLHRV